MLLWMVLAFSRESHFSQPSTAEGGVKTAASFVVICPALTFFLEKSFAKFNFDNERQKNRNRLKIMYHTPRRIYLKIRAILKF